MKITTCLVCDRKFVHTEGDCRVCLECLYMLNHRSDSYLLFTIMWIVAEKVKRAIILFIWGE